MKKHTDNGFTFDIKEDHAAVIEIDGNPQIVEIPEQIDGVSVTELAEYLFSGKSCQVIRIPLGVRKIGRYGFYNCRNLEELWFSSDFTDLGSGAFTGCHRRTIRAERDPFRSWGGTAGTFIWESGSHALVSGIL